MNQKAVLDFLNDVIFENAIKNDLKAKTVKKSIEEYQKYLQNNSLADETTLKFISRIEENTAKYLSLAKSMREVGLNISVYNMVTAADDVVKRVERAQSNTSCGSPNASDLCCGRSGPSPYQIAFNRIPSDRQIPDDSGPIGGNC